MLINKHQHRDYLYLLFRSCFCDFDNSLLNNYQAHSHQMQIVSPNLSYNHVDLHSRVDFKLLLVLAKKANLLCP